MRGLDRADRPGTVTSLFGRLSGRTPWRAPPERWGEGGVLAIGEYGRHPVAAQGEAAVADGVDAAVDAGEAAGGHSLPYAARAQTEELQLGKGDQVVLALRQVPDT